MRTLEKDYTYLLLNVIPHRRLLPDRRRSIQHVLSYGDEDAIRREAVLSLEELVGSSYLRRESIQLVGQRVTAAYSRGTGGYRIHIQVPLSEWELLFPEDELSRAHQEVAKPAVPPRTDSDHAATAELVPKLIRSFAITERNGTLLQKLDALLERLARWFDLEQLHLYLIEEQIGKASEEFSLLTTISEQKLHAIPIASRVRNTRAIESARIISGPSGLEDTPSGREERMVSVPIYLMDELWGILEVTMHDDALDDLTRKRIAAATGTISQVIENNVRLENLTSIDKLTGIYNRQFYDMQLSIEIERATRSGSKLSMLMIDIDDFKKINDDLGHKKGDEALIIVADLIRKNLRKIDLPFRYGGEEFVILLPGTAQMEAIHTAERLRSVIAEYDEFKNERGDIQWITVSIGIAVYPDHSTAEEDLFINADKAMYKAKRLGKNRVEIFKE